MARRRIAKTRQKALKPGFTAGRFEAPDVPDYVVTELRYEAPLAVTTFSFVAPAAAADDASRLNNILARIDVDSVRPQFGMRRSDVRKRIELAATLPVFDLSNNERSAS
jgi:hypothetical protein